MNIAYSGYICKKTTCLSSEVRSIDYLTIKSYQYHRKKDPPEKQFSSSEAEMPLIFNRPTIFLTARVHSREVQASLFINALILVLPFEKKSSRNAKRFVCIQN